MAASLRGGAVRGAISTARFLRTAQSEYRRMLDSAAAVCSGLRATGVEPARAILVGLSSTWGFSIAEALGVPCVACMLQPFGRTRAFPSALVPLRISLGGGYNALSYRVVEQAMWRPWRRTTNAWRGRALGLPPLPADGPWRKLYSSGFPCLYGFSPAIVTPPADWPPDHLVTGYWFLDDTPGGVPRPALERFFPPGRRRCISGSAAWGRAEAVTSSPSSIAHSRQAGSAP